MRFRRKQQLCREWQEKVFGVIQGQIDAQLASISVEEISARRRELMEHYIRVSNEKRYGLYRDIIIESEYDPMVAHNSLLRYQMSDSSDPLKMELVDAQARGSNLERKKEVGRGTLSATMWDKLDSTPYGRFDRLDAGRPKVDFNPETFTMSRVPFEHYKFTTDRKVLDREFPRGKRMDCEGVRDQRGSSIFDAAPLEVS
jgi:hypothetical protein